MLVMITVYKQIKILDLIYITSWSATIK